MKIKSSFTLIEIVVCMAILALASAALAWPIKNMVSSHRFNKSISYFASDLKRGQILALSNQTDLQCKIFKKGSDFYYHLFSEDPIPLFLSKPLKLAGVVNIKKDHKNVETFNFNIYSSGIIEHFILQFIQSKENGVEIDLTKSELRKIYTN